MEFDWKEIRDVAAVLAALFTVVLVAVQIRNSVHEKRMQGLLYLHEYLSREEFSTARREVRSRLKDIPYEVWSKDEKNCEYANRVCVSYDQAGILVLNEIIHRPKADQFFSSSWGDSVIHQYRILEEYLSHQKVPNSDSSAGDDEATGREFFRHFAELYEHVCALRSKSGK